MQGGQRGGVRHGVVAHAHRLLTPKVGGGRGQAGVDTGVGNCGGDQARVDVDTAATLTHSTEIETGIKI